jgi:hypothetical protein
VNPCVYCGTPSSHYTLYVCETQRKRGHCAGKVISEIVMSGSIVQKAREQIAIRRRTPHPSVGFHDLGEIS